MITNILFYSILANPFRYSPWVKLNNAVLGAMLAGGFFLILILIAVVRYGLGYLRFRLRVRNGQRTTGKVVSHEYKDNNYYAVIQFSTVEARIVRFTSSDGQSEPRPPVGERVELMYDPKNTFDVFIL